MCQPYVAMSAIRIIRQRLLTGAFLEARNRARAMFFLITDSQWSTSRSIYGKFEILDVCRLVVIESNFDRSACRNPRFRETWLSSTVNRRCIIESIRFDSIRPHGKPFSALLPQIPMISSNFTAASFLSPSISQWELQIERVDSVAKTYPGNFLLRVNLVVLRGRSKVQVPFAISTAYSHPVYLVLARSSIQTENRKKLLYRLPLSILNAFR